MLLASCGSDTITLHQAPRVTNPVVPAALLEPCPAAKADAPDPKTASVLDAARFIVILAARNDDCAGRVEQLRALLAP